MTATETTATGVDTTFVHGVKITWVGDPQVGEIGLAYAPDGIAVVAAAHRQSDVMVEVNGGFRYALTTSMVGADGVTPHDGSSAMSLAHVRHRDGAIAWLVFMARLASGVAL